jgi:hypothetical protein
MILKSPNNKISIINLFADYILKSIPVDEDTIIQIADCGNFCVIKGKTTYNIPLDVSKLSDEFCEKFSLKLLNTIDLIEYDCKIKKSKELTLTYYNTSNCSYHPSQIDAFNTRKSSSDSNFGFNSSS